MNLFDRRLLIVAGKGGVGRTTVAASLALAASQRGKRTLLCQTKSKERLSSLFGSRPIGEEVMSIGERLWSVNMTPKAALREYGTMVLKSKFIAKRVLENRMTRSFLRAIPGLEDYSMLGKAWFHTTEMEGGRPKYDLVIMDGPATGHLVTLLTIPQSILNTIPDSVITESARDTQALLTDARRAMAVLVTLAEDMPTNETIELAAKLTTTVGMKLGPVVVNQLYPPRFSQGPSARALELLPAPAADDKSLLAPLLRTARTARARRAVNERYLQRLNDELKLPMVQLPHLFTRKFGPESLADMTKRLDAQVATIDC